MKTFERTFEKKKKIDLDSWGQNFLLNEKMLPNSNVTSLSA